MPISKHLQQFLEDNHASYEVLEHDVQYSSPRIAESLGVPGHELAKVVMIDADRELVMAVVPANYHVEMDTFRALLGAETVGIANEIEFGNRFPDCEKGAMPPFGGLYKMRLILDEELRGNQNIVFQAGNHRTAIRMPFSDYNRLAKPEVAAFSEQD